MSSLNASLAVALSGLAAEEGALAATTNNVANVNTPGYTREVPVLATNDPVVLGNLTFGSGVDLQSIESIRDPILEARIQQETQTQGQLNSLVSALQQTQVNFTDNGGDVGTAITNFFNAVNQLSANPSDLSVRQGVITAAENLATAFNTTANNLSTQRSSLDQNVGQTVSQVNQLSRQIAQLNGQIADLQNAGENAGTFLDQRTQLIDQLSGLVGVSVIPSDNTLTLTTANGSVLVAGEQSYQLQTQIDPTGVQHVYAQNQDITSSITSGQLGGLLQARDQQVPALQNQLDTLAAGLANAVNGVQTAGFDLHGNAGTNLFNPPPAGGTGAAAGLSVAITDPSLIAASSDGTQGSNGNAEALYALNNQSIIGGQTPTGYYSGIVFNVGNATANATAEQTASTQILQQLNDQRSAISGVSLNEEAANMVQYQQAYSASAQVVTTINDMMYAAIQMTTLTG